MAISRDWPLAHSDKESLERIVDQRGGALWRTVKMRYALHGDEHPQVPSAYGALRVERNQQIWLVERGTAPALPRWGQAEVSHRRVMADEATNELAILETPHVYAALEPTRSAPQPARGKRRDQERAHSLACSRAQRIRRAVASDAGILVPW